MHQQKRLYNFNAGPAALPLPVLEEASQELVNYQGQGLSVMEMSHRSTAYETIHQEAKERMTKLLDIPDDYEVLFLQGGASLQFCMVPMNFLHDGKTASYVLTGSWSEKALQEAKTLGDTSIAASTKEDNYTHIPSMAELDYDERSAYVHITSNNTIFGTQWSQFPDTGQVPLVADMSSDMMSRPVDVRQFGCIYAGAQKNLGPSGVTVVIIRKDMLAKESPTTPTVLKYSTHAKKNSLYHTPPTYSIYMLGLVMKWIEKQGGLGGIHRLNRQKADLIYQVIDDSDGFYEGHAQKEHRSQMNITFRLPSETLEKTFLKEAQQEGFSGLNGHRSVGGCRASIYNAVPQESCQALKEFMEDFQRRNC